MPFGIQGKAAAASFVACVRGAGGVTQGHRLIHSVCLATREPAAAYAEEPAVPVRCRYADPNPHLIAGGRVSGDGCHPAHAGIGRINHRGFDGRVRQRHCRQALARTHRLSIRNCGLRGRAHRRLRAAARLSLGRGSQQHRYEQSSVHPHPPCSWPSQTFLPYADRETMRIVASLRPAALAVSVSAPAFRGARTTTSAFP